MKPLIASLGLAAVTIMAIGCDTPTAPGVSAGEYDKTVPVSRKIDPVIQPIGLPQTDQFDPAIELTSPKFNIYVSGTGTYRFVFTASADAGLNSPGMTALKSLRSITFLVYSPGGRLLNVASAADILISPMTGIDHVTAEVPFVAMASARWKGYAAPGSYVVMNVYSDKGIYIKRQNLPVANWVGDKVLPWNDPIGTLPIRDPVYLPHSSSTKSSDHVPDIRFSGSVDK